MNKVLSLVLAMLISNIANATNNDFSSAMPFEGSITGYPVAKWLWGITDEMEQYGYRRNINKNNYQEDGIYNIYPVAPQLLPVTMFHGFLISNGVRGTGLRPIVQYQAKGDMFRYAEFGDMHIEPEVLLNRDVNADPGAKLLVDLRTSISVISKNAKTGEVTWVYESGSVNNAKELAQKALDVITKYNSNVASDYPNIPLVGQPVDIMEYLGTPPTHFGDIILGGWYTEIVDVKLAVPKSYPRPMMWRTFINIWVSQR